MCHRCCEAPRTVEHWLDCSGTLQSRQEIFGSSKPLRPPPVSLAAREISRTGKAYTLTAWCKRHHHHHQQQQQHQKWRRWVSVVTLRVAAEQFDSHADRSRVTADRNEADTASDHWRTQFTHLRDVRVAVAPQHLPRFTARKQPKIRATKPVSVTVLASGVFWRGRGRKTIVSALSSFIAAAHNKLYVLYTGKGGL